MGKKTFEIILGTYEEFVLGFNYTKKEGEITPTFAIHSHTGSVRSLTQSGDLLASGGTDDRIVVYDLKTRKEHCMLTHHSGTINCLQFTPDHTHLISGSQDGTLSIVRAGNWQLEKLWEGAHKGSAILDIAVHNSGKLALTLGADCTLRTWNLVKGRQAYVINLNSKCKEPRSLHSVKWAPDGIRFALVGGKYTEVWSIETGGLLKAIEHETKVGCLVWKNDDLFIVGYEDGKVGFVDVDSEIITTHEAHNVRVKCISILKNRIVTAGSDGEIKVWDSSMEQLDTHNAGCRFTCMCIAIPTKEDKATEKEIEVETVIEVIKSPLAKKRKIKSKKLK